MLSITIEIITFYSSFGMQVLEGHDATRENILSSLEEVSRKAESGSVVVIHFSGHGYELPDEFDQGLIPATLTKEMVIKIIKQFLFDTNTDNKL